MESRFALARDISISAVAIDDNLYNCGLLLIN
jgi:hypothetical protein